MAGDFVEKPEMWEHSENATGSSTWQKFAAHTGKAQDIPILSLLLLDSLSPELLLMDLSELLWKDL